MTIWEKLNYRFCGSSAYYLHINRNYEVYGYYVLHAKPPCSFPESRILPRHEMNSNCLYPVLVTKEVYSKVVASGLTNKHRKPLWKYIYDGTIQENI